MSEVKQQSQPKTWAVMQSDAEIIAADPKVNPEKCTLSKEWFAGRVVEADTPNKAIYQAGYIQGTDDCQEMAELLEMLGNEALDSPVLTRKLAIALEKAQDLLEKFGRSLNIKKERDEEED